MNEQSAETGGFALCERHRMGKSCVLPEGHAEHEGTRHMDSYGNEWPGLAPKSTCLMPMWDGGYRMRCGLGTEGVCYKHGPHQSHPDDGRSCDPNPHDRYCHTHGVYMAPGLPADAL